MLGRAVLGRAVLGRVVLRRVVLRRAVRRLTSADPGRLAPATCRIRGPPPSDGADLRGLAS